MSTSEQLERMRAQVSNIKKRAEEQGRAYMRTGVMAVAGGALGAADKKWGEDAAFGMSTSLATGLGGHLLALLDVGGEDTRDALMAIGDAGLCVYAYKQGYDLIEGDEPPAGAARP
jgi:hypothetical protein